MSLRSLFVRETLEAHALGSYRLGLSRVRQCALVAMMDGRRELVIERRTGLGPLTLGTHYLHVPADGLADVDAVAQALIDGRAEAPTASNRRLRALLRLTATPFQLGAIAFLVGALLSATPLHALPELSGSLYKSNQVIDLALVVICAGLALRWAALFLAAQVTGESLKMLIVRHRCGHPSHVRPMGTWRGALGRGGALIKQTLSVKLQVMATVGGRRELVMTRAHTSPFSVGIALFAIPAEAMPALREAIRATRGA